MTALHSIPKIRFTELDPSEKKGKPSESIFCIGKIADSDLLKLFINNYGN